MIIITNTNQLRIIKSVSTPNISKTLDVQENDGHLFIKQTKTISILLINIKDKYKPLLHIKHKSTTLINIKRTCITLINIKINYKLLIHIKHTSIILIHINTNNYKPLIHITHTSIPLINIKINFLPLLRRFNPSEPVVKKSVIF